MSIPPLSPARRIRRGSIRLGLWISALALLFIDGYALQDQLEIGHASAMFMLGTAVLAAGICIGLFDVIVPVGLAASAFFSEQPPGRSPEPSGSIGPVGYSSNPRIFSRIKPDTIRRPAFVSKRKRHFRGFGS
jgi:hypothetical protein